MAKNVLNAFVGTAPIDYGVYFRAKLGTPLPETATEVLNTQFKDHGAVGEDGFTTTPSRETSTEKTFDGEDWVNIQTGYSQDVVITLLEDDNIEVIKTVFGDANVVVTAATASAGTRKTIYHTSETLPISAHILNAMHGGKRKRYVIERGQPTELAEIKTVHSESTKYQLTIKTYRGTNADAKFANVIEYREGDDRLVPSEWTVTLTDGAAGDTFTLTVGSTSTAAIPYNADAATVQAALVAALGANAATVTGAAGGPYAVALTAGGALTATGTGLTVAVTAA